MEREQILKKLQNNAETLINTLLPQVLKEGQEVKYKNYINALSSTLDLIDRYSWQLNWSKFRDETGKQFISIWEQNIDNQIRNNKTFAVDEFYNNFGGIRHRTELKSIIDAIPDKYLKTSQRMLDLFNEVKLNKKSQVIYTDNNMRNIGKTYSLMEILRDNEDTIMLLTSSEINNKDYRDIERNRFFRSINNIRGTDIVKIILIDESVSKEMFEELDKLNLIYCGYRNINTL